MREVILVISEQNALFKATLEADHHQKLVTKKRKAGVRVQKHPAGQMSRVSSSRVPPTKCQMTSSIIRPALVVGIASYLGTPRVNAEELLGFA